ncbi:unnamed protein product [Orchesella dallaii]|uniref:C2H2-type domain-containing protein n=1 Tax=Orchesella dallaii TaxID=48710 RepID=A0ABP1QHE4_9HEXA
MHESVPARSFSSKSVATRHERAHSGMGDAVKFACVFCGKTFSCQPNLNHHILHHINEKGFECRFCKSTFVTQGKFKRHIAQVHSSDHSYSCVMCGKSFSTNGGLTTHIHSHTREKPFTCSLCAKNFINNSQLQRHINTIHKKIKRYTCKICGRGCLDLSALNIHVRRHIGETTLECKLCNKRFCTATELKRHEVSHHQCPHCTKKLSSTKDLDNHIKISHAGKGLKYRCPCGAKFKNRYLLKSHRLSSHKGERIFKCDHCPKAYLSNVNLTHHNLTHLNRRNFKCAVCNKAFVYKSNHDDHMRIHTGENPFRCSVCGRPFGRQSEVKSHERIHQDVGDRYGCVFCG